MTIKGVLSTQILAGVVVSCMSSGCAPADDPLDTIIALLRQARIEAQEATAVGNIRAVRSAQYAYKDSNSFFDDLSCLARPRDCRPQYPASGPSFLDESLASLESKLGYRRRFHRGPAPESGEIRRLEASQSSTEAFAYTAVPESPDEGTRGFCGDDTARGFGRVHARTRFAALDLEI